MKKVQKTYMVVALLVVVGGMLFYGYIHRSGSHSFVNNRPLLAITVDNIGDYLHPNSGINALAPEQWVEIVGQIKEINTLNGRHTVLLKGKKDESPYIICDIRKGQEKELKLLKENDTIKVKGIFKGFLKDAIFLHCIIIHQNLNE